jgi:hypothetical protein
MNRSRLPKRRVDFAREAPTSTNHRNSGAAATFEAGLPKDKESLKTIEQEGRSRNLPSYRRATNYTEDEKPRDSTHCEIVRRGVLATQATGPGSPGIHRNGINSLPHISHRCASFHIARATTPDKMQSRISASPKTCVLPNHYNSFPHSPAP